MSGKEVVLKRVCSKGGVLKSLIRLDRDTLGVLGQASKHARKQGYRQASKHTSKHASKHASMHACMQASKKSST